MRLDPAPHQPSSALSSGEEAIIVACRKHTLLPLDDCLYALQPNAITTKATVSCASIWPPSWRPTISQSDSKPCEG